MRRSKQIAAVSLFFVVFFSGTFMAAFQFAAWGNMLAHAVKHESLRRALTETFSGHHNCGMCRVLRRAVSGCIPEIGTAGSLHPISAFVLPTLTRVHAAYAAGRAMKTAFHPAADGVMSPPFLPPRPFSV